MRQFLDLPSPQHYGPRGFLGRQELPGFARNAGVEVRPLNMARDTGEESGNSSRSAEEASALRPGLSVSANGSPTRRDRARKSKRGPVRRAIRSALARGFRLSTELVAGDLVGGSLAGRL